MAQPQGATHTGTEALRRKPPEGWVESGRGCCKGRHGAPGVWGLGGVGPWGCGAHSHGRVPGLLPREEGGHGGLEQAVLWSGLCFKVPLAAAWRQECRGREKAGSPWGRGWPSSPGRSSAFIHAAPASRKCPSGPGRGCSRKIRGHRASQAGCDANMSPIIFNWSPRALPARVGEGMEPSSASRVSGRKQRRKPRGREGGKGGRRKERGGGRGGL